MKLAQIALSVLLVGAGIFVYDAMRGQPAGGHGDDGLAVEVARLTQRVAALERAPADVSDPIALPGNPDEALRLQLQRLADRLAALEGQRGTAGRTTAVPDAGTEDRGWPTASALDLPEGSGDPENPTFAAEDVARFKALYDEMQRVDREQRFEEMIDGQLQRLGVSLTDDQRNQVIEQTRQYRAALRDALRVAPRGEDAREKRIDAIDGVRNQYIEAMYRIVPAADADKIIDAMARAPNLRDGRAMVRYRGPTDGN